MEFTRGPRHGGWDPCTRRGTRPHEHENSRLALQQAGNIYFACQNCAALVHLRTAQRYASLQGRTSIVPSDGCASRECSAPGAWYPKRFRERQLKFALSVENGHLVVTPPRARGQGVFRGVLNEPAAACVAWNALFHHLD